jgi:murein DD-endopeptidase MepM/ murein hydrolase activator NlpD
LVAAVTLAATAMPAAMVGQQAIAEPAPNLIRQSQQVVIDAAAAPQRLAPEQYSATTGKELRAAASMRTASTFENDLSSAVQWPFPVGVPLTDRFGPRAAPCSGCSTSHKGLDMTPGVGSPISVIADGVVLETDESDSGFGVYAKVEHLIDGRKYVSLYAHMQFGSLQVIPGQVVRVGDQIGAVGNTGQSTGPHLHLEIWRDGTTPVDPYAWLTDQVGT